MRAPTSKQVFIGIWIHDEKFPADEQAKMKWRLNRTFYYSRVFDRMKEFTTYIRKERLAAKIFLIISTATEYSFLLRITKRQPDVFHAIYVFLPSYLTTVQATPTDTVITDMIELFHKLSEDITCLTNNNPSVSTGKKASPGIELSNDGVEKPRLPPLSTFNSKDTKDTPIHDLNKETAKFLCFLAMTHILFTMPHKPSELEDMLTICRDHYEENYAQCDNIDEFGMNYESYNAISYYTANRFIFRMVNQAFGAESIKEIFPFRVYITDLHKQLNTLHEQNTHGNVEYPLTLYRGKMLSGSVLQQLIDNSGGLISMNGFLSTTRETDVSLMYAGDEKVRPGYNSVLFQLRVDESMKRPFADISQLSDISDDAEVLFSVGTIWEVMFIRREENIWKVGLKSCDESNSLLTEIVKKYAGDGCTFHSLGDFFYQIGNDSDAEYFYREMLKQDSLSNESQAILLQQIAMIRFHDEDNDVAIEYLEKTAEKIQSTGHSETETFQPLYVSFGLPSLTTIFHNIGLMHQKKKDFERASVYYEKALKEGGCNSEIAAVHNNMGLLHLRQGKYQSAVNHHLTATKLIDENHIWLPQFKSNLEKAEKRLQDVSGKQQTKNKK